MERLERLEKLEAIRNDARMAFYSAAMAASSGRHTAASRVVDELYGHNCLFCDETANITKAHIVAGNHYVDYSPFGVSNGYCTDLDVKSPRNFIPLCGSLGREGTCHHAFDKYLLTIMFDPITTIYRVISFDPSFAKHAIVHNRELNVPAECRPYTRLLTWRARKCMLEHGSRITDDLAAVLTAIDLSDVSKASDDSEDEAETIEGEASF